MADLPIIYRFPNHTLIKSASYGKPGYLNNKVELHDEGSTVALSRDFSEDFKNSIDRESMRLYEAVTDSAVLYHRETSQEVVSFIPVAGNPKLKEITAEEFEQLSSGFRRFYEKKLSEPSEVITEIEARVINVNYDLKESVVMGIEPLTELHSIVNNIRAADRKRNSWNYNSNSEPYFSLERNLPLSLSAREVMKVLGEIAQKSLTKKGVTGRLSVTSPYRNEPVEMNISFYEKPYDGSIKKILDRKRDGKPYADRRGRHVPDMPATAGLAHVTEDEISSWWRFITGDNLEDNQKFAVLQAFTQKVLSI